MADGLARGFRRVALALGLEPVFLGFLLVAFPAGAGIGYAATHRPATAPPLAPPPVAAVEHHRLLLVELAGGSPVAGVQVLEAGQGDSVTIGIEVDAPATVSMDGYGVWAHVRPGERAVVRLVATAWGRFELRADGRLIAVLSVRPAWAGPA